MMIIDLFLNLIITFQVRAEIHRNSNDSISLSDGCDLPAADYDQSEENRIKKGETNKGSSVDASMTSGHVSGAISSINEDDDEIYQEVKDDDEDGDDVENGKENQETQEKFIDISSGDDAGKCIYSNVNCKEKEEYNNVKKMSKNDKDENDKIESNCLRENTTTLPPPPPPPPLNIIACIENRQENSSKDATKQSTNHQHEYDKIENNVNDKNQRRTIKTLAKPVLPPMAFIPPQFNSPPNSESNIKPSEYLKKVANRTSSMNKQTSGCKEMIYCERRKMQRSSSESHLHYNHYEVIKDQPSESSANDHHYEICDDKDADESKDDEGSIYTEIKESKNCDTSSSSSSTSSSTSSPSSSSSSSSFCKPANGGDKQIINSTLSKPIITSESNNSNNLLRNVKFNICEDELKKIHLKKTVKPSNGK